jgi:hypothetical protein
MHPKYFPTYHPKCLWVFIFECVEKLGGSLYSVILKRNYETIYPKYFPTYHPKCLWVFIFECVEKMSK